jgi:hypothetical protein
VTTTFERFLYLQLLLTKKFSSLYPNSKENCIQTQKQIQVKNLVEVFVSTRLSGSELGMLATSGSSPKEERSSGPK